MGSGPRRAHPLLIILGGLALLLQVGGVCGPDGLPVETVARSQGGRWPDQSPGLVAVTSVAAVEGLGDLVTPADRDRLRALTYGFGSVVVVFQGQKPSAGYSVRVQRARWSGGALVIEAAFDRPRADHSVAAEVTSPYEIVRVVHAERSEDPPPMELFVGGRVVARTPTATSSTVEEQVASVND
jgi:hypothetical protein